MRSALADALAAIVDLLGDLAVEGYLFGAQAAILHGSPRTTADIDLTVATAEDMIVMKVLAGRGKDLDDARAILIAQRGNLDLVRVRQLLTMLDQALDRSDLLTAFNALEAAVPTS